MELEWLRQTEVLYYRLERSHSNAAPQLKHNPWSLKCQQQHLQKMKENAKHRNQYSILFSRPKKDVARPKANTEPGYRCLEGEVRTTGLDLYSKISNTSPVAFSSLHHQDYHDQDD